MADTKRYLPNQPLGGSVFLYDRKVVRYFRKDSHNWRKKKDGKTVKEAHEKLKAGSIDVLHCYYAHGEDNENFQRRSYWMLEQQLEHIVLVHYREVKEGYKVGASRLQPVHPGPLLENPQSKSTPCFESGLIVQKSHTSSPSSVDWKQQALFSELHSGDSKGLVEFSRDSFQLNPQVSSFMSTDFHSSERNLNVTLEQKFYSGHLNVADLLSNKLTYARLDVGKAVKDVANSRNRLAITSGEAFEILQKWTTFGESDTHPLTFLKSPSNVAFKERSRAILKALKTIEILEIAIYIQGDISGENVQIAGNTHTG